MNFRLAKKEDERSIQKLYCEGSKSLQEHGVDQWQGSQMPTTDRLEELIEKKEIFVLEVEGEILGTVIMTKIEPAYEKIEGKWLSQGEFFALHRFVVTSKNRQKGYGKKLFQYVEERAIQHGVHSLRVDTHKDNIPMQNLLKKSGYTYCGKVMIGGNLPRIAFEKLI